jgi:hypothetical protein
MSTDLQDGQKQPRGLALYAVMAVGIIVVAVLVTVSLLFGGLPGTKESPSANAKGVSTRAGPRRTEGLPHPNPLPQAGRGSPTAPVAPIVRPLHHCSISSRRVARAGAR